MRQRKSIEAHRRLSIVEDSNGCWIWQLYLNSDGYGKMHWRGRNGRLAYNVFYEELVGPIPVGLTLDHTCRNRACVNPAHLEPVTFKVNIQRGNHYERRRTHCPQGHPYDEENTRKVMQKNGTSPNRLCRACQRERSKQEWIRRKAQRIA